MTIGCVQVVTKRGMLAHKIGSRNTVPPRMLRIVPLGDFHIFLSLNSVFARAPTTNTHREQEVVVVEVETMMMSARNARNASQTPKGRGSSERTFDAGLIRSDGGALDADVVLEDGLSAIDRDLVVGLIALLDAQIKVEQLDVEVRQDQLVLDQLPDDATQASKQAGQ